MAVVGGVLGYVAWRQERALAVVERLLETGDLAAAFREFGEYQRTYPADSRAIALHARLLLKAGRPNAAAQLFEQHGAANAVDLHAWAQSYMRQSQWSLAAPILARFLQLEPRSVSGLYELMVCNIRMGRLKEALDVVERLARLPNQQVLSHLYRGTIYNELKNKEQAAVEFGQVLHLDPDLRGLNIPPEDFLSEYGSTLVSLGRSDEAIGILKRSLETRATAEAAVSLGQAHLQLGETRLAVANWELAVRLAPESHRARESLADLALRDGQPQTALEWLQPLQDSPKLEPATAFLFQQVYQRLGDSEQAAIWQARTARLRRRQEVESAVALLQIESPNSYWAQIVRAYRFAQEGNWSEAQRLLQQLHSTDSKHEFVQHFQNAVKSRGALPPLESIPIRLF
jgi:tetratricopeptide (TPR) repeat protein